MNFNSWCEIYFRNTWRDMWHIRGTPCITHYYFQNPGIQLLVQLKTQRSAVQTLVESLHELRGPDPDTSLYRAYLERQEKMCYILKSVVGDWLVCWPLLYPFFYRMFLIVTLCF
jgi:hypothetical protein